MGPAPLLASVLLLVTGTAVSAAPEPTAADTTLSVTREDRLVLENFEGRVSVGTSEDATVHVQGRPQDVEPFLVRRSEGRLTIRAPSDRGHGVRGPFRVTVPPWLPVQIRGRHTEVEVRGLRNRLEVRTLHGSIRLFDVVGGVEARTVHGELVVEDVSGSIRLGSVEEDVRVRGGSGELEIETVDGDLILERMTADRLTATSVDGDVLLEGRLPAGSRHRLTTHDGDLRVVVGSPASADVTVSTFDGEFESDFPVTLRRFQSGREMSFTLGDGGSELILEAFDGDIELRRNGG